MKRNILKWKKSYILWACLGRLHQKVLRLCATVTNTVPTVAMEKRLRPHATFNWTGEGAAGAAVCWLLAIMCYSAGAFSNGAFVSIRSDAHPNFIAIAIEG